MNKKDLVEISTIVTKAIQATVPGMIKSAIEQTVPGMIKETVQDLLEQNNHILKLELRDEMYAMNKAMENRLIVRMDNMECGLRQEMRDMRTEIVTDIGEILDQAILPQISDYDHRIFKIENQLAVC